MPHGIQLLIKAVDTVEGETSTSANPKMVERCGNALCSETHVEDDTKNGWTKWELNDDNGYRWLCGPCSTAYQNGQYCLYCEQIYWDASADCSLLDGKDWIECEGCRRWAHVDCEVQLGEEKKIKELLATEDYKYHCGPCRQQADKGKKGRKLPPKTSKAKKGQKRKSSFAADCDGINAVIIVLEKCKTKILAVAGTS